MFIVRLFLFTFLGNVTCDMEEKELEGSISHPINQYYGDQFPIQYLGPEETVPDIADLKQYVKGLRRVVYYFNKTPNKTDCNIALGSFYTKALLKRTLQDYGIKLIQQERERIVDIINKCENILSHFVYKNYPYGWEDMEFRVSRTFKDDSAQVFSIGAFNKGRLKRWLFSNIAMNDYVEEMDNVSLTKMKYIELTVEMDNYYISSLDSDICASRIAYESEPIDLSKLQLCRPDKFCYSRLHSYPSVSYALSHRLLNIMMRRHLRRCFLKNEEHDVSHMDLLCAFMYREAVYLARRGFFARDLFLEHIALCGMLGYEEFQRRRWFNKALSWINEEGCIKETRNFDFNTTRVLIKRFGENDAFSKKLRKQLREYLYEECHTHPTALLLVVLSHGIRYAAHYLPLPSDNVESS
ncbi:unnamed protein product [Parnassius mnemosyne]|uniref:Uncharacterized protein n=1 Tax=Parnassius mnemosyne TaxID=213953 RepID=A0AAV1LP49_9NEOP